MSLVDVDIISICDGPETLHKSLSQLMPEAFGPHNLR